jgi:hypothetical protein
MELTIVSGGQSGVDRAALEVAGELGIPYAGWCPRGGWAEDVQRPPGVLATYPNLRETPADESQQRTAWNVRDSDATLIITSDPSLEVSPASRFTLLCADLIFVKPWRVADVRDEKAAEGSSVWLLSRMQQHPAAPFRLNLAGPRESEVRGIQEHAALFLRRLLLAAAVSGRSSRSTSMQHAR